MSLSATYAADRPFASSGSSTPINDAPVRITSMGCDDIGMARNASNTGGGSSDMFRKRERYAASSPVFGNFP